LIRSRLEVVLELELHRALAIGTDEVLLEVLGSEEVLRFGAGGAVDIARDNRTTRILRSRRHALGATRNGATSGAGIINSDGMGCVVVVVILGR